MKRGILQGHYNTVTCCIYTEHFQTLYSGANDRNILVWASESDVLADEEPSKAETNCHRSLVPRRNLTEDAWSSDEG